MLKERLRIRSLEKRDFELFRDLQSNVAVREFLGGIVEPERIESKFNEFLNSITLGDFHFVVEVDESKSGIISLSKHIDSGEVELSFQFLPQFWGEGIARQSCEQVINKAFHELKASKVVSETQKRNIRSRAMIEKLGMVQLSVAKRFGEEQVIYELRGDKL